MWKQKIPRNLWQIDHVGRLRGTRSTMFKCYFYEDPKIQKRENSTPQPSSSASTKWIALDSYPRQLDKEKLFSVQGSTRETLRISPEITHFSLRSRSNPESDKVHRILLCAVNFMHFLPAVRKGPLGLFFFFSFLILKNSPEPTSSGSYQNIFFWFPFQRCPWKEGLGPFYRWDLRSCGIIFA